MYYNGFVISYYDLALLLLSLNQASLDHVKVFPTPCFLTEMFKVFVFDLLDNFWQLFLKYIENMPGSLEQLVKCDFLRKTNILPKISLFWLKFGFQLSKDTVLELGGILDIQSTSYWYLAEGTVFWAEVDGQVTKHCHLS